MREIVVHDWQARAGIDVAALAAFLGRALGVEASPVSGGAGMRPDGVGGALGACRVADVKRPFWRQRGEAPRDGGVALYDGHELLRLALAVAGPGASPRGALHVMVTDLLVGTYDDADARYHARPVVASNPSLLSTASAVWGPARSRRDYGEAMAARASGGDGAAVEAAHAAEHLVEGDARMAAAIRGYAMQAAMYALTGEAFCDDASCCLHDAHWQTGVLSAVASGRLCAAHGAAIGGLT